jgi:hypothetical protein
MKAYVRGIVALSLASYLGAATITFKSGDGNNEYNNTASPNRVGGSMLGTGANWVDFAGGVGISAPSCAWTAITDVCVPTQAPTGIFYETITLPSGFVVTSGLLKAYADDVAGIWLNGTNIWAVNVKGNYGARPGCCAAGPNNPDTMLTLDLSSFLTIFNPGANTLEFRVWQIWGGPWGVNYSGSLSNDVNTPTGDPVPEPATLALVGAALLGAGFYRRSR